MSDAARPVGEPRLAQAGRRDPGSGRLLRVDEAPLAAVYAVVVTRRDRARDRPADPRRTVICSHWDTMSPREQLDRLRSTSLCRERRSRSSRSRVLGVLVITGEYSTGMIRASFTAVPKRLPVLWAKAGVFAAVTFVLMLPSVVIAFFASQALLPQNSILQTSLSDHSVARVIVGGAVYLTLAGVLALAIGAILRNTAGAISAFAALFFVIPPLMHLLPSSWDNAIKPVPAERGWTGHPLDEQCRWFVARRRARGVCRLHRARPRRGGGAARPPRRLIAEPRQRSSVMTYGRTSSRSAASSAFAAARRVSRPRAPLNSQR